MNHSKRYVRFLVAHAVWEELGEHCSAFELAEQLLCYAQALGNEGFTEWVNKAFRVVKKGNEMLPSLAMKLREKEAIAFSEVTLGEVIAGFIGED